MQKAEERENVNIYRDVFKRIVKSHIEKLLKREEFEKDIKIKLDKRDENIDIDIESRNDNSENDNENDFRYFENNTFLKSDESECESENYINDETDDEKDSDNEIDSDDEKDSNDENQVNDKSEVIND